jgi:phage/plasmid-associated DNA primase
MPKRTINYGELFNKYENDKYNNYVVLNEVFNMSKLKYLIDNYEENKEKIESKNKDKTSPFYIETFTLINKYFNESANGNITVKYKQSKYGRFYACGSLSLQSLSRVIRHTIANEFYYDVDVVNAHPIFLSHLCKKNGFKCPNLNKYIKNRDECLEDIKINGISIDREKAKKIYLALTNGGKKDYNEVYNKLKNPPLFLKEYKKEMEEIHDFFAKKYKKKYEKATAERKKKGKDWNHKASFTNKLLCDFENNVLMNIYEFFKCPKTCVLCFDGLMILKSDFSNDEENNNLLKECENFIFKKLKININLKFKEMNEGLQININEEEKKDIKVSFIDSESESEYSNTEEDYETDYENENTFIIQEKKEEKEEKEEEQEEQEQEEKQNLNMFNIDIKPVKKNINIDIKPVKKNIINDDEPEKLNIKNDIKEYKDMGNNNENNEINDLLNKSLSGLERDISIYLASFMKDYKCIDADNKKLKKYNGFYWEDCYLTDLDNFLLFNGNDLYNKEIIKVSNQILNTKDENKRKELGKIRDKLNDNINKLSKTSFRRNIKSDLITLLEDRKFMDLTDKNPYLFCFNNAIFDLKQNKFIEPKREQYITMTCGYDYIEPVEKDIIFIKNRINEILTDETYRNFYLKLLSQALHGNVVQKFVVANNGGSNGKSTLHELVASCCGNYFTTGHTKLLDEKFKISGSCPEIAEFNKKRFILFSEPESNITLSTGRIKEFTNNTINARMNYSNITKTTLNCLLVCECNTKPKIKESTAAIERRIIDFPFDSFFLNKQDYEERTANGEKNIFMKNTKFCEPEFQNKYKIAMFKILSDELFNFLNDGKNIDDITPDELVRKSREYVCSDDGIYNLITEMTEESKNSFIKIADIYEKFKYTDFYENSTKKDKRTYNLKYFNNFCEKHIILRKIFKKRYRYRIDKVRKEAENVLIGLKFKDDINEESKFNISD